MLKNINIYTHIVNHILKCQNLFQDLSTLYSYDNIISRYYYDTCYFKNAIHFLRCTDLKIASIFKKEEQFFENILRQLIERLINSTFLKV